MVNDKADDQALAHLRRESEALRRIAPAKRKQAAQPRHAEYKGLIARAAVASADFDDFARELDVFPPMLVGQAVGQVWEALDATKRAQALHRLRALDADRHGNEGLPLGIQLLRTPSTAAAGADVLSALPSPEKSVQRVATELFGGDGIPIQHLAAPADAGTAVTLWRLLFKAAFHEKAQSWRRLQFLKLVLGWLAENERFKDPQHGEWVTQCRDLSRRLDSTAISTLRDELQRREVWREILGDDAAASSGTMVSPVASAPVAASPSTSAPSSTRSAPSSERATQQGPAPRGPEMPREPTMSVEEARDTLVKARNHHEREMRAIDRLLGAVRAAEARNHQLEGEATHAREQLRRNEVELEKVKQDLERARMAGAENDRRLGTAVDDVRELRSRLEQLQTQLTTKTEEMTSLQASVEKERFAGEQQKKQLEAQVLEHATVKLDEFKQRIGRKVDQITRDLHPRKSSMDGNTAAAVLNTRLHEVLDLLAEGGLPIRARD